MLFDTHAHMDDRAFDADRAQLLTSLPQQGLSLVMNPGCSLSSSRNVDKLTREYDYLYGAVGSHPDVCDDIEQQIRDNAYKLMTPQARKAAQAAGRAVDISADEFEG